MVDSGTPVHSDVLVSPCVPCTVFSVGSFHSVSPLPEHSMKWKRDTDGKRSRSDIVYFIGRSTIPWMMRAWRAGSMLGMPPWWRSKCSPDGVMMPCPASSGVMVQDDSLVAVGKRHRTSLSN